MAPDTSSSYIKDLKQANELINKYVSITTLNQTYFGYVDAIDPITESIILSTKIKDSVETFLILGNCIKDVTPCEPPSTDHVLHSLPTECSMSKEEIKTRKDRVHSWLLRNLLPVKDVDNELQVHDGTLFIKAPYRAEDCLSSNSIILGRVQHLIQNMPDNFSVNEL